MKGCAPKLVLITEGKTILKWSIQNFYPFLSQMRSMDKYRVQTTTAGKKEREVERELIMAILEKVNNFKIATHEQVEKSNQLMRSVEFEVDFTKSISRNLFDRLKKGFERVKDLFRRSFEQTHPARMASPGLARAALAYQRKKDEMEHKDWPTNTELLTKISNELAEIEEYTTHASGDFLKKMESMKTGVKERRDELKDMDGYVEKEFSEVKELIRKNCKTYNEDNEEEDFLASIGVIRT